MGRLPYGIAHLTTYEDENKTAVIDDGCTCCLTGGMPGGNMCDLMGHSGGSLGLSLPCQGQTCINKQETAGKREGVYFFTVDQLDGKGHLNVRIVSEVLPQPVDVFPDRWIGENLGLHLDFFRQFPAKSHFSLKR